MKKKEYLEPEMRVIEVELKNKLMQVSDPEWHDETGDESQF